MVFVSAAEVVDGGTSTPESGTKTLACRRRNSSELSNAMVDVGSHSLNHRSLGRMDSLAARSSGGPVETRSSRALLGRSITAFAYPFGTRKDFNALDHASARRGRVSNGFTSQHGAIAAGADPYTLPRIKVEGGESLWMFKLLVSGGLDGWGVVDRPSGGCSRARESREAH